MESLVAPPLRFATVCPGVTRGAYPTLRNFRFLGRLQLKVIISLIPESPTLDLTTFAKLSDVTHHHFPLARGSLLNDNLLEVLTQVINIIIDPVNHPVYVHCLDGRRITSLVVLLLRRLQGWTPQSAFSEYWRYQVSIKYPLAPNEVEKTTKEVETFASEISGIQLPDVLPKWLWSGDRSQVMLLHGVQLKTITPSHINS